MSGRPFRRWTEADEAELRELFAADEPLALIARRLGRTEQAVQERKRLLGLMLRRKGISALKGGYARRD